MTAANSSLTSLANYLAAKYGTKVKDVGNTLENNQKGQQIFGDQAKFWGGMAFSSKEFKEGKRTLDKDKVLAGVRRLSVESWKYKKGIADEGKHIGPYAEDVQREFGDSVAPGGKVIDMISMFGVNLAAMQALASKVEALEGKRR
jgi:hypothetical protein